MKPLKKTSGKRNETQSKVNHRFNIQTLTTEMELLKKREHQLAERLISEQPLYEPDGCGRPTLYSGQARFQHFTNSHTDGNISNLRIPAEIKNKETYPTAGTRLFC